MAVTSKNINGLIRRIVAPLARRLRLMVSRGVVKVVNDSLKCQGLQVALLSDELQDDVERFQEYGFTSTPFTDGNAEALFLSVGGNRSHGIVACVTDRTRRPKNLLMGDVCLYTDKGERVYLDRTNDIVHIGAKAAAEFIALATKVLTELQAVQADQTTLKGLLVGHVHPGVLAGGASTSPSPAFAGYTPHTPASVAATKVKAT